MSTLLLNNAEVVATMDAGDTEIANGGVFCRDGVVEVVGRTESLPKTADTVLDMRGQVVLPGLVNTHHHLFQSLTRAVPAAQNETLFGWLRTHYPIWAQMTPRHFYTAAAVGLAELAMSGCTTCADHQYLFPNGARLEDSIAAAQDIGMRFIATRGAMSIGQSQGGLPPDSLTENEEAILKDCERVISRWHDAGRYAMVQIGIAPCSPFSVSRELMRASAELARTHGVGLHTHLAENAEDVAYSEAHFGMRPGEYAESVGWTGADVWHAHCVQLNRAEIDLFARSGTGVAHCPCSNMRLASGIAPVRQMLDCGVHVGLGVDGSASNDSGHLLGEVRQAMLLQRVASDAAAPSGRSGAGNLTAREALSMATRGGACVLGRDDIGVLAAGYAADMACFDMRDIAFSGAHSDPLAALVFCTPMRASHTIINGRLVVADGVVTTANVPQLLQQHRTLSIALLNDT